MMRHSTWRATGLALIASLVLGSGLPGFTQDAPEPGPAARAPSGGRLGDLILGGNLVLPDSSATRGNILKGDRVFLHERGSGNIGLGQEALASVGPDAEANIAVGASALRHLEAGFDNTAVGLDAISGLVEGDGNVAVGRQALGNLVAGRDNIAIGGLAGGALEAGSGNIYIGVVPSATNESDTIRIGDVNIQATFIRGIHEHDLGVLGDSHLVGIAGPDGRLGLVTMPASSARFKTGVETLDDARDLVSRLRPVTFRYRPGHGDSGRSLRYGLIAEEVAEVAPEMVRLDAEGRPLAVHYDAVPILLLADARRQRARLDAERADLEAQRRQLEAQARALQAHREALEALQARLDGLEAAVRGRPAP